MLTKAQKDVMNRPIWRGNVCIGYEREILDSVVAELVLSNVHPSNLGQLPPKPERIAEKAIQIGLIGRMSEAFMYKRVGQFN